MKERLECETLYVILYKQSDNQKLLDLFLNDICMKNWKVYINDSEDIICLLEIAMTTVKSIKAILKVKYPLNSFDICMSLDDGKDNDVSPSVTIRFYANRGNNFISHDESDLEKFDQPVLIESIN